MFEIVVGLKRRYSSLSPSPLSVLGFKFNIYHKKLWAEQFLRTELQSRWKEINGNIQAEVGQRTTGKV